MTSLEASFERCRQLNKASGTTYYWATELLPRVKRHYVHALYGFCRYADDIVDDLGHVPVESRADALRQFGDRFLHDLADGRSDDLVCRAVVHTAKAFDLSPEPFQRFLRSMEMDLTIDRYDTFDDLLTYMDGSAAVIGELMVPILEPVSIEAVGRARDLGIAFQLTNFLRDVAEDLQRGRIYLPQEDVRKFDAADAFTERRRTPAFADLMAFEIGRTRAYYLSGDIGVGLLRGRAQRCVMAARSLYGGILDQIEAVDHDVWTARVRVPSWRKVATGLGVLRP
ncbi:MAG TPA: phytoene/squalene synthase family protein [Acidimicrobiales bacterium]|nr:phytoene/squalene synthase family protein [Acidimicrobiales bacterium]